MSEKKPNLHKTLLILILVFIPPYWLLFTEEGGRVSDTALLWLLGEDDIAVDVSKLDSAYTQADIKRVYTDNEWTCGESASPFGDGVCATKIGAYNGFPSRLLTFYFKGDRVSAMKLVYRDQYHEQIIGSYIGALGQPQNVADAIADGPEADSVLEWDLGEGVLLIKKDLGKNDEPSLLWLAARPEN